MVTSVTGQHVHKKSNDDVLLFHAWRRGFNCFPRNLEKLFKNMNQIIVDKENITTLTRSDLQPFGRQLKKIWFRGNQVEVISADLFEDTINLEVVDLSNNNIKYVAKGAFKMLKYADVFLFDNPCYSKKFTLISQIEKNCIDEEAYTRYKNQLKQ